MNEVPRIRTAGPARAPKRVVGRCKTCGHALLDGQPTVWLSKPLGLSHEECPS